MVIINNKNYKLLLLDTNALSNFLKSPKDWIKLIDSKYDISRTIISYSIFSLMELYQKKYLFDEYMDFFSVFPSAILDGYDSIFRKEIESYCKSKVVINPIVIAPYALVSNNSSVPREKLEEVLRLSGFYNRAKYWLDNRKIILNSIIKLKSNYPPKNKKYSLKEIEDFEYLATIQQIMMRDISFTKEIANKFGNEIDTNRFPSVRTTSYVVFYKFYPDNRKPLVSDVIDIIISSLLPYVDYFITESNLYEIIRKIQKNNNFLSHLSYNKISEVE